jgi:TatD DNase family protein
MTEPQPSTADRPPALVDSHCHLNWNAFDADREAVVQRALAAGVTRIVTIGVDLPTSRQGIALAETYAAVYAAVGIHPNDLGEGITPDALAELRRLAAHPKVVAIGEIGLDYHWQRVAHPVQQAAFEAQLALAAEVGRPVIIHNREADADVAATLRAWVAAPATRQSPLATRPFWGVLHSFSGDRAMAEEAMGWGFLLSFAGPLTFTNARALQQLVTQLPLDRLMIETDAPYLTPHPYRGQRNEPARVVLVAEALARLHGRPVAEVAAQTTATAGQFFGW